MRGPHIFKEQGLIEFKPGAAHDLVTTHQHGKKTFAPTTVKHYILAAS